MTARDPTHQGTIDWNRFWAEADGDDRAGATPSTHHAVGLLFDLFTEKSVPDSFADVGCGPGEAAFEVAAAYPETAVVGYDAAESVLAENRARAAEQGLENIAFERVVLPEFDPGRQFGVVFCYGTLEYVAESARALRNMYDAVEPGGALVLGYVNEHGRAHYRRVAENPEERLAGDDGFDPDRFGQRFELVLEGESTLSYREIHDALGTWPRSFWEFTDRPEEPWAWEHVPLVWVPR